MIEHIHIRNFKSLRDVQVDLKPLTVLIGRSGTGKSSFLRAIRFLRNYLQVGNAAIAQEGGWEKIHPFGQPAPLEMSIRFLLPNYEVPFTYDVQWAVGNRSTGLGMHLATERLLHGTKQVFEWSISANQVVLTIGDSTSRVLATPDQLRPRLGQLPTITEAVLAYAAWTTGIGWHDFPSDVFVEPRLLRRSRDTVRVEGLTDTASNYLRIVREMTQNLRDQRPRQQLLARAKKINPGVAAIELDNVLSPTKVIVTHQINNTRIGLELEQESDGFRRFYAHLLAIYQTPAKLVLMFEEPENGIYPGALKELADEFSHSQGNGRGQVLLTTHSPQLLDEGLPLDSLRAVDLDADQTTRIAPLAKGQREALRQELLTPGDLITITTPQSDAAESASTTGEVSATT